MSAAIIIIGSAVGFPVLVLAMLTVCGCVVTAAERAALKLGLDHDAAHAAGFVAWFVFGGLALGVALAAMGATG